MAKMYVSIDGNFGQAGEDVLWIFDTENLLPDDIETIKDWSPDLAEELELYPVENEDN